MSILFLKPLNPSRKKIFGEFLRAVFIWAPLIVLGLLYCAGETSDFEFSFLHAMEFAVVFCTSQLLLKIFLLARIRSYFSDLWWALLTLALAPISLFAAIVVSQNDFTAPLELSDTGYVLIGVFGLAALGVGMKTYLELQDRGSSNSTQDLDELLELSQNLIHQREKAASIDPSAQLRLVRDKLRAEIGSPAVFTLGDELKLNHRFLQLASEAYPNRIRCEFHIQSGLNPNVIPIEPFIIQTLVENSIGHGLLPRDGGGEIRVLVETQGPQLRLSVVDDGIGFDNVAGKRPGKSLSDLRDRLRNQYGGNASYEVFSRDGGGIVTVLMIPLPDLRPAPAIEN